MADSLQRLQARFQRMLLTNLAGIRALSTLPQGGRGTGPRVYQPRLISATRRSGGSRLLSPHPRSIDPEQRYRREQRAAAFLESVADLAHGTDDEWIDEDLQRRPDRRYHERSYADAAAARERQAILAMAQGTLELSRTTLELVQSLVPKPRESVLLRAVRKVAKWPGAFYRALVRPALVANLRWIGAVPRQILGKIVRGIASAYVSAVTVGVRTRARDKTIGPAPKATPRQKARSILGIAFVLGSLHSLGPYIRIFSPDFFAPLISPPGIEQMIGVLVHTASLPLLLGSVATAKYFAHRLRTNSGDGSSRKRRNRSARHDPTPPLE
ncbi:uncharacterized protein PAN0_004d2189 [Moesziomyces antarcticus]|uniref:Uncharacterized protein n=2 Tax=Pseudozyma antarctica TaxID=84753 RepID=A0A5C3FN48_PSEA2|nr:uncharacterized protein PAN0_004d2189 [Moesziomyces antarcticus]GAK63980.1 hypothetical protein PAN0_004d2189 [Moesziomyces antarcticus]SPO44809.1 uncharacterized protein PSANT_02495 [Moesziomyces antarcticus]